MPDEPGGLFQSRTCLLPMITQDSRELLRLFTHYGNRLLPNAGGILDQPHFYLEAMEVLSARAEQNKAEWLEKMKREAGGDPRRMLGGFDG